MLYIFLRFVVFSLDPFSLFRRIFIRPAIQVILKTYNKFRTSTGDKANNLCDIILRFGVISFIVSLIIWIAVFLYAVFYYVYMPPISHIRPVHLKFKTCLDNSIPCTFPNARVSLTHNQQLLMVGQTYRVLVNIDMPESPQNLDLGMFMICAEMRDKKSMLRGHSCRSAMMRYRSPLIRTIMTWSLSPLYVLGLRDESQQVSVEIFNKYMEQRHHPITDVYVEIQSQKIQFYSVTLHIVADFTGLRYIMYNWPILSAVIAISSNLFFILLIFLLSWYHWSESTLLHGIRRKYYHIKAALQNNDDIPILKSSKDSSDLHHEDDESNFFEYESEHLSDIENIPYKVYKYSR